MKKNRTVKVDKRRGKITFLSLGWKEGTLQDAETKKKYSFDPQYAADLRNIETPNIIRTDIFFELCTIEKTSEILLELQEKGADLVELGIPYSDPLADGPIIQLSASRALKSGTTAKKVIKLLESLKGKLHIPIIL